jgi:adenylate kinase family enzyme
MRIVVVGTSGAGKTTLARRIAAQLELEHIELDAITWLAGWCDLTRSDPKEYLRTVSEATSGEAWVVDGGGGRDSEGLLRRATHLVWLDYERPVVMARIIRRSLLRGLLRTKLWVGNRERLRDLLRSSGPILWSWRNWARRRRENEETLGRKEFASLTVLRLRRPSEVTNALRLLATAAHAERPTEL